MRWIHDLHLVHENEEIWIAGSGPSLDMYPNDFLDGRLATALHLAYLKFPDTTYRHANEYDRIEWFARHRPEYLAKQNIFGFPFYRRTEREMDQLIDLERPNYYFCILRPFPPKDLDIVHQMVKETRAGSRIDFRSHGTCLHDAIYAAIMMGCSSINIIGCNHEPSGDLEHFKLANDNNEYRANATPYNIIGDQMKIGTQLLIDACKLEGIEINWIKRHV